MPQPPLRPLHSDTSWIEGPWPGRLAIAARPHGGDWLEDEMKSWRAAGLDTVVSLLTSDEEEGLDLQRQKQYCRDNGLEFRSFPIIDRGVPASDVDAVHLIEQLDADLARGKNILVHCRQGIGRSGLIAAGLLIARGVRPQDAVKRVSTARSAPVPETLRQQVWITDDFPSALSAADSRLGGR